MGHRTRAISAFLPQLRILDHTNSNSFSALGTMSPINHVAENVILKGWDRRDEQLSRVFLGSLS